MRGEADISSLGAEGKRLSRRSKAAVPLEGWTVILREARLRTGQSFSFWIKKLMHGDNKLHVAFPKITIKPATASK